MESSEFTPDYIVLTDEDGVEQEFEFVDSMEIDDEFYYALLPVYKNSSGSIEDDGELVVLKAVEEVGEEILVTIDDDDEYDRVGRIFLERLQDYYEDSENIDSDLE